MKTEEEFQNLRREVEVERLRERTRAGGPGPGETNLKGYR